MKTKEFQKQLDLYKNRVYGQAWYMTGIREDAEDVTQEVFVKLWNHWDHIDRKKVGSWLMRVTHNLCMDLFRKKKNIRTMDMEQMPAMESGPSGYGDPESQIEAKETRDRLVHALNQLPPRTREILLLHYFQDMQLNRVGEIMDLPLNTVKVAIHRGRKKLRDIFMEAGVHGAAGLRERTI